MPSLLVFLPLLAILLAGTGDASAVSKCGSKSTVGAS